MIKYAITDPTIYNLEYLKSLENRADWVLFRDKKSLNYSKDAKKFIKDTTNYNYKKIIHQDYKLAKELNTFGVHLTSIQFSDIKKAKELELFVIISTHSIKEIKQAELLGADVVTFSPIFNTPNKGKAKGIDVLQEALNECNINIIALGGIISKKEIEEIKKIKAFGFASIRYFITQY